MIKKLFFILGSHIFHTERFVVISLFRNDLHLFIARIKFLLKPSQQDVYRDVWHVENRSKLFVGNKAPNKIWSMFPFLRSQSS